MKQHETKRERKEKQSTCGYHTSPQYAQSVFSVAPSAAATEPRRSLSHSISLKYPDYVENMTSSTKPAKCMTY